MPGVPDHGIGIYANNQVSYSSYSKTIIVRIYFTINMSRRGPHPRVTKVINLDSLASGAGIKCVWVNLYYGLSGILPSFDRLIPSLTKFLEKTVFSTINA